MNESTKASGYSSGLALLSAKLGTEGSLLIYIKSFNAVRIDRVCETTNVFDASLSDRLSLIVTLGAGALMSVEALEPMEANQDRGEAAKYVCLQTNSL
ncbi:MULTISPECIES: hypothetical protein [Stenotrophomonas]|uniref:hypothetical protein n=1 Tax=Stenotrophomonas TaxID=40323 RepID=UPI002E79DEBE|nr:hypothetical protein [Stenotrophomonas sepilia]